MALSTKAGRMKTNRLRVNFVKKVEWSWIALLDCKYYGVACEIGIRGKETTGSLTGSKSHK